jgi:hypothetical protein
MKRQNIFVLILTLFVTSNLVQFSSLKAEEVVRPEEIKSKRQVIYDDETYIKLMQLWKNYYDEYPSEYAYANWMYAARYAGSERYTELLSKGLGEYPANPVLLYLKSFQHHGAHDDMEGRKYLEKAIALDPDFADPWFGLVIHYMDLNDRERLNVSLRRLLESGVITDEVMDYNYNMLVSLDENAILITNGDNDTYPGWILQHILDVRPDVAVVNRSLLNTDWYPLYVIKHGLSRFIDKSELENLRDAILVEMADRKAGFIPGGLFGDTLILRIIESAERAGRPVYFAKTLYATEKLRRVCENGRDLGLVTLVTESQASYAEQLRIVYKTWLESFRTSGLDSWRLAHSSPADGGRRIVPNYATGAVVNLEELKKSAPELRLKLFNWYIDHIEKLLPEELKSKYAMTWCCYAADIKEIDTWRKKQGMECPE